MQILFVTYDFSGISTYSKELINYLQMQGGIDIYCISLNNREHKEFTIVHQNCINYIAFPFIKNAQNDPEKYAHCCSLMLSNYIQSDSIPIVHVNHISHISFVSAIKKTCPACKIVFTCHYLDSVFSYLDIPAEKFYFKNDIGILKMLRVADKIIAVTKFSENTISEKIGIPKSKVTCIYNGISLNNNARYHTHIQTKKIKTKFGFYDNERLILFVGRVNNDKGIDKLIQAFKNLHVRFSYLRLVVVGNGDYENVQPICSPLFSRVTFTGILSIDEINELYQIAEIGVVPSEYDQCSYVALEMMKHALPVVISDVPGLNELIQHNKNGMVCKTNQREGKAEGREVDVNELIQHIAYLLKNTKDAERLGQNALKSVHKHHSVQLMGNKTLRVYKELISHKGFIA